jgi:hypothetical protein
LHQRELRKEASIIETTQMESGGEEKEKDLDIEPVVTVANSGPTLS